MNNIEILNEYMRRKDAGEPIGSLLEIQAAFAMSPDKPKKKLTIRQREQYRAKWEFIDRNRMILG